MPSEKELDQALHAALDNDAAFRSWLLTQLGVGATYASLPFCRSNHPWGKVRLILPNPATGALEPVDREGETDVLAVFENDAGERLGIHIENKRASGTFTPFQAEVLAARAERWIGDERYGAYHAWKTVLLAASSFIVANELVARKFMHRLTHEEVATFVPLFSAP